MLALEDPTKNATLFSTTAGLLQPEHTTNRLMIPFERSAIELPAESQRIRGNLLPSIEPIRSANDGERSSKVTVVFIFGVAITKVSSMIPKFAPTVVEGKVKNKVVFVQNACLRESIRFGVQIR